MRRRRSPPVVSVSIFFSGTYPAPANAPFQETTSYGGCTGIYYSDYIGNTLSDPCYAPYVASARVVIHRRWRPSPSRRSPTA